MESAAHARTRRRHPLRHLCSQRFSTAWPLGWTGRAGRRVGSSVPPRSHLAQAGPACQCRAATGRPPDRLGGGPDRQKFLSSFPLAYLREERWRRRLGADIKEEETAGSQQCPTEGPVVLHTGKLAKRPVQGRNSKGRGPMTLRCGASKASLKLEEPTDQQIREIKEKALHLKITLCVARNID